MRKKRRSAVVIISTVAGMAIVATGFLLMPARAQQEPEATMSDGPTADELARPERADYWAARAARAAQRAADRGEPMPPELAALLAPPPAPEPAAAEVSPEPGGGGGGGGGELVPSDEALAMLRQCESGGDYTINTGNGYYGAYQFAATTWWALGYEGYAHQAPPAVQDQAVRRLYAQSGWYPWPGCSRHFGWI